MWDKRYGQSSYAYGTAPNDFLEQNSERIPAGRVLCMAAGEGRNAVYLAQQGYEVTAVDSSNVGLSKARKLAARRGVTLQTVTEDLEAFPIWEESFSGIISIFCHLPTPIRRQVHRAAVAGLRPGGVLILEAYTPKQLEYGTGGPPVPELLFGLPELEKELHGLTFEIGREVVRSVVEGKYHTGDAAVVQVVAMKPW